MDSLIIRLISAAQAVRDAESATDEQWAEAHHALYDVLTKIERSLSLSDSTPSADSAAPAPESGAVRRPPNFGFPDVRPDV